MGGAKLTAVLAAALLALYIVETVLARGVYNDDDLGHYLLARDAWAKPELFLNVWGRPLFTLVYAVPARFGYQAVQLTTAIATALTAALTGAGAARLGAPAPLGAALYGTMPFVLLLSYSSLTEPICALVVAGALWAWLAGRRGLGLALAALAPLGRLELLPLVVLWGVLHAVRSRRWLLGLIPAAGVLGWGIIAAAVSGDPLWIVHQIFTGQDRFYAPSGLWHYPRGLIYVVGPVVFLFALTDLVERAARRRLDLVALGQVAVVALYAVFSWKLAVGQAAGFLRHLVAVAPLFALSASRGVATALGGDPAAWRRAAGTLVAGSMIVGLFLSRALVMHHRAAGPFEPVRLIAAAAILAVFLWLRPDRRGAGRTVAAGLTVLSMIALVYAVTAEPPLPASAEQEAVQALWEWFEGSEWAAAPVVVTHPWFLIELEAAGRRPPGGLPQVQRSQVEQAPPGTVIVWDSHYSIWPPEGMQLRDFKFDPRYTMLRESISADRRFAAYALLKTH